MYERFKAVLYIIFGAALGCCLTWMFFPREVVVPAAISSGAQQAGSPVQVDGSAKVVQETEIGYHPKSLETESLPDGTERKTLEKTDVELDSQPPEVHVKVNGEEYQFKALATEKSKFEQGKLVVKQGSTVDFNLQVPRVVVDKSRKNAIGYGYNSHHDEELTYRHAFSKSFGAYVRGEGDFLKAVHDGRVRLHGAAAGVEFYF